MPLAQALEGIDGWRSSDLVQLDRKIIDALFLDEYVNNRFSNGSESVFLYVGYYLTSKKVGAAHSPLVCFPGQGWILDDFEDKDTSIRVDNETINLRHIIATLGNREELLLYWWQAFDKTSPDTFPTLARAVEQDTLWVVLLGLVRRHPARLDRWKLLSRAFCQRLAHRLRHWWLERLEGTWVEE